MSRRPDHLVRGDDPLPADASELAREIRYLAAARRRDALTHPDDCTCDGCRIREQDEAHIRPRAA